MSAPAGWLPDPENLGQLRYWDGGKWTEHRSPAPEDAPSLKPQQAKSPKSKQEKKEDTVTCCLGCALVIPLLIPIAVLVWLGNRASLSSKGRRTIGTMLIIGGVVWSIFGLAGVGSSLTVHKPVIPPGTPAEVLSSKVLDDPDRLSSGGMIAYRSEPYDFDVSFKTDSLKSLDGIWYGSDASLSVDGEARGEATPTTTYADVVKEQNGKIIYREGESLGDVRPSAHVSLPIDATDQHKSIVVRAEMTVGGFNESGGASTTVQKSATFYVVSPEDMKLRKSVDDWNDRVGWPATLVFFGVASLFLIVGIVQRWKDRARLEA